MMLMLMMVMLMRCACWRGDVGDDAVVAGDGDDDGYVDAGYGRGDVADAGGDYDNAGYCVGYTAE